MWALKFGRDDESCLDSETLISGLRRVDISMKNDSFQFVQLEADGGDEKASSLSPTRNKNK